MTDLPASLPNTTNLRDLLVSSDHSTVIARERSAMVVTRARQFASVFAILTLAWIAIDAYSMPWPIWGAIAWVRIVTAAAFAGFAMGLKTRRVCTYCILAGLVAIPLLFFAIASFILHGAEYNGRSLSVIAAYYFLPFVLTSGLGVFPLTALESAGLFVPIVLVTAALTTIWPEMLGGHPALSTIWRLMLIAGIAGLVSMSQLRFLIMLTNQATRDGRTGLLVRKAGEEVLAHQFDVAQRGDQPLTVLFVDLDEFKKVNDQFGHEAGDKILRIAADRMVGVLRREDIAVRWGGEEFVVALPDTGIKNAEAVIRRLASVGIGERPDGVPVTASIGVAGYPVDRVQTLQTLIALADERMYRAKQSGRNRYVLATQSIRWLKSQDDRPSVAQPIAEQDDRIAASA